MLNRKGIKHEVLNAKYHDKEAEIVAQAGKKGAVTIATKMAGRGTDIMLGGNAEYLAKSEMRRMQYSEELIAEATGFAETKDEEILEARKTFTELNKKYKENLKNDAEEVRELGGLFIMGTEPVSYTHLRAQGECLGTGSRRRTRLTAISHGEP